MDNVKKQLYWLKGLDIGPFKVIFNIYEIQDLSVMMGKQKFKFCLVWLLLMTCSHLDQQATPQVS